MDDVPQVVARAAAAADAAGFPRDREKGSPSCCSPGTGRVLAMLAASRAGGRIGEIGTGTGYGTSWMASAMPAGATLLTVELDAGRAEVASMLFDGLDAVHVVHGDARAVIAGGVPTTCCSPTAAATGTAASRSPKPRACSASAASWSSTT